MVCDVISAVAEFMVRVLHTRAFGVGGRDRMEKKGKGVAAPDIASCVYWLEVRGLMPFSSNTNPATH
jgi:hypothetical protein